MLNEIIKYGKLSEQYHLNSFLSGNISYKKNSDSFLITKSGTALGNLKKNDIIEVFLTKNVIPKEASMETIVHKAIYKNINTNAIIHTHSPFSIIISNIMDNFTPIDSEGEFIFKKVKILKAKKTIASEEVANKIVPYLKGSNITIIKNHGVFAIGETLKEAFYYVTALEQSAKIYYFSKLWK